MSENTVPPKNIVDGTDEIIRDAINALTKGREWFWTKTTLDELSKIAPPDADLEPVILRLWEKIESNWKAVDPINQRGGGASNWRWKLLPSINYEENESPETRLEKALALALKRDRWANQIPTSSGLISSTSDRKRNIDVAHWDGDTTLTLIELKIASDTLLFAAFEIILNSLLLCLARKYATQIKMVDPVWSKATKAHLRVVAPAAFYRDGDKARSLGWFEEKLSAAVSGFGSKLPPPARLEMDFGFRVFDLSDVLLRSIESAKAFGE
jgi:hypothetical protein